VVSDQRKKRVNEHHSQVQPILLESGIQEGLLLCNAMYITASVFINDSADILRLPV
jgi:thiamine phosphate synthase YjbQ (UPF0047 family)